MNEFKIVGGYIELIKLLKATGIAENGSDAKAFVEAGKVSVNAKVELRKRAKLVPGDVVLVAGQKIKII